MDLHYKDVLNLSSTLINKPILEEIIKYCFFLVIIHLIGNLSEMKSFGILKGGLFNEEFLGLLLIIAIAIIAYHLVVIEFKNTLE